MLSDSEFCREYVKRIPKPLKQKTTIQMVRIVENKESIDLKEMFDDEGVKDLYIRNLKNNPIGAFVYTYIRDNQKEFTG